MVSVSELVIGKGSSQDLCCCCWEMRLSLLLMDGLTVRNCPKAVPSGAIFQTVNYELPWPPLLLLIDVHAASALLCLALPALLHTATIPEISLLRNPRLRLRLHLHLNLVASLVHRRLPINTWFSFFHLPWCSPISLPCECARHLVFPPETIVPIIIVPGRAQVETSHQPDVLVAAHPVQCQPCPY